MSRLPCVIRLVVCLAVLAPAAAAAQSAPPAGAPPIDQSEGGGAAGAPMRIGSAVVSGSVWLEALKVTGDTEDETTDTFRIRRARVGLAGSLTPRLGYSVTAELTSQPALRNAFLLWNVHPQLNVRLGQSNPIAALDRGTSALSLELIDRSLPTNELTGPADIGVTFFSAEPYRKWLGYALNVTNGAGFNKADDNDSKDVSGRIALTPPVAAGVTIVASGARGEQPKGLRTRAGIGIDYKRAAWHLMAERLRQRRDNLPTSDGYFVMAAYRHRPERPSPNFYQWELAARFSVLNDHATAVGVPSGIVNDDGGSAPLTEIGIATTREFQSGANYYLNQNIRIMGDVIVPLDDRQHPGPTAIMRWQVLF